MQLARKPGRRDISASTWDVILQVGQSKWPAWWRMTLFVLVVRLAPTVGIALAYLLLHAVR